MEYLVAMYKSDKSDKFEVNFKRLLKDAGLSENDFVKIYKSPWGFSFKATTDKGTIFAVMCVWKEGKKYCSSIYDSNNKGVRLAYLSVKVH